MCNPNENKGQKEKEKEKAKSQERKDDASISVQKTPQKSGGEFNDNDSVSSFHLWKIS